MRLLFIRHGEAMVKENDSVLTSLGKKQAKELARNLSRLNIVKVFCSNLTRAKQTCEEFTKLKEDLIPDYSEGLNEIYRVVVGGPEKEGTSPEREERDKKRAEDFLEKIKNMKGVGDVRVCEIESIVLEAKK